MLLPAHTQESKGAEVGHWEGEPGTRGRPSAQEGIMAQTDCSQATDTALVEHLLLAQSAQGIAPTRGLDRQDGVCVCMCVSGAGGRTLTIFSLCCCRISSRFCLFL